MPQRAYRLGDEGPAVAEIRSRLVTLELVPADDAGTDRFDAVMDRAVREFQQVKGLVVDGAVGPQTYRRLDEAHWRLGDRLLQHNVGRPLRGDDVATLQQRLADLGFDPGRVDAIFGPTTAAALHEFQSNVGVTADGVCGPVTFAALGRLSRTVTGGAPIALREHEAIRRSGPTLAGKIVVLDPCHGEPGAGEVGRTADGIDLSESAIAFDIASRIEGRLSAMGVQAFLTRPRELSEPLDDETRAAFANEAEADAVVSLHCESHGTPEARGIATYYYGADKVGAYSAVGERLARLVQDEVVARTDLLDGRIHPKTWDLLRFTAMPAVRVELGYLSNEGDAARLADPAFRDALSEAIVTGIENLFTTPNE